MWATVPLTRQQWPDYATSASRRDAQPPPHPALHSRPAGGAAGALERAAEDGGCYKATLISGWPHKSAHCVAADPPQRPRPVFRIT